jgi:Protein of unknown function (DUF3703)
VSYEDEMDAGHSCMSQRDWPGAYRHFRIAHDLGHAVRSRHLAAHRAAVRVAARSGPRDRLLYQLVFLAVASLTSWNTDLAINQRPADPSAGR